MKQYPEEKRKNLAKRDVDDFIQFFGEIKGEPMKSLQRMLTPPKGFQKNRKLKQETLNYFYKQFISNLKREKEISNLNSDVWNKFRDVFMWWVKSKPELFKILSDFENEDDFDTDNESFVEPNSPRDVKCFDTLIHANLIKKIDQETIRCFYDYGYFNIDKDIENLISNAFTRKEIEQMQQLETLPNKFDKLSETIKELGSRISAVESADELKQKLEKQITELSESFGTDIQKLNQQITEVRKSLNARMSKIELSSTKTDDLSKQVNSLKSQHSNLKKLVNSLEDKHQTTDSPRVAYQAVEIGKNAASLVKDRQNYKDENNYLENFKIPLWLLGITKPKDSSEAEAIHIALKAFSAIEITDTRIIDAWQSACGNNLHITTIEVGMGWLDWQDWFPRHFSEKCFGERMRPMDMDVSIEEMFKTGNLLWAINLRNCDRSYPESYLPDFLNWLGEHKNYVKVFLTRCQGPNRCDTSFEVYNEVGKLPKPIRQESIQRESLPDFESVVFKSDWEQWCQPADEELYQTEIQLLENIRSEIENIPTSLLQDIRSYLLLSHQIFDPNKALDWALYLRLYPWLAGRIEIEDTLFNFINQSDLDLPRTTDVLQGNL